MKKVLFITLSLIFLALMIILNFELVTSVKSIQWDLPKKVIFTFTEFMGFFMAGYYYYCFLEEVKKDIKKKQANFKFSGLNKLQKGF